MKKIWILFWNCLIKNMDQAFLALLGGIALSFLFQLVGGLVENKSQGIPVGLLDKDQSVLSRDFKDYLSREMGMRVTDDADWDELTGELIERHISGIIEIPKGYFEGAVKQELPPVTVTSLDDYENAAFLQAYLNSYQDGIRTLSFAAGGDSGLFASLLRENGRHPVKMKEVSVSDLSMRQLKQRQGFSQCMGFFMMLSLLLSVGVSYLLYEERANGVYRRIQAAMVKPAQYVTAMSLFGLFTSLLLAAVFFLWVRLSGFDIGIPLSAAVLLAVVYSFFVTGFSLAAGLFISSRNAILALVMGWATITSILGGCFFPIDTAPVVLQRLSRLTPQYWVMDAVNVLQGGQSAVWLRNALVVLLFGLLCYLAAGIRFARRESGRMSV